MRPISGWVKIHESWAEADRVERLGSDAVMLHLSALGYSARHLTDGAVPARALRRLWPVEDPTEAIDRLVSSGFWESADDGYLIVDWREHILASDEVEKRRDQSKVTSERYRRHRAGDHSMCDRCEYVRKHGKSPRDAVTDDMSDGVTDASVTRPEPNRTDPTRREGRYGEESGRGRADARSATAARAGASPPESVADADGAAEVDRNGSVWVVDAAPYRPRRGFGPPPGAVVLDDETGG